MSNERPILFSAAMVRALLDGTKTQTRRICKAAEFHSLSHVVGIQNPADIGQRPLEVATSGWFGDEEGDVQFYCPYGKPGDRLWVRETWAEHPDFIGCHRAIYRADPECKYDTERWRPSIHMPRWASRILLEIVSVRVERLNDISEADALAEGIDQDTLAERQDSYDIVCKGTEASGRATATSMFRELWESINGPDSWEANPWVWEVEFKKVQP